MTIQLPAKEVRKNFSAMLNTAAFGKKNIVVTRFNKPTAVLMDYEQYERLMDPSTRFTDKEWRKGFEVFNEVREKNKDLSTSEIEKTVNNTIKDVRKERRKTTRGN